MKVRVQVIMESDNGETEVIHEVAQLHRGVLQPAALGLTLAEAKNLLQEIQQTIVSHQVTEYLEQQAACPHCGKARSRKGRHEIVFRTAFGKLRLISPRWYSCPCQPTPTRSFSPLVELLSERTAPELTYLETKFASLMSYGLTVDLLNEVLPIGNHLSTTTIRRQVQQVAERTESELGEEQWQFIDSCPQEWESLPPPDGPLTVGLDGGYVHSQDPSTPHAGWFEVIVGKSVTAEGASKCFGFVPQYDTKPKRRLFEVLTSQGMQMNQQITFLSDGGETVRDLQLYLNPQAEHVLDWFHIVRQEVA